jgi:hypothetical protein
MFESLKNGLAEMLAGFYSFAFKVIGEELHHTP